MSHIKHSSKSTFWRRIIAIQPNFIRPVAVCNNAVSTLWLETNTGTGAMTYVQSTTANEVQLVTGTTDPSTCLLTMPTEVRVDENCWFSLGGIDPLSEVAQTVRFGICVGTPTTNIATNWLGFEGLSGTANWRAVNSPSAIASVSDTGIAYDGAAHRFAALRIDNKIYFYIDDNLVATHGSNMPDSVSGANFKAWNTNVGAVSKTVDVVMPVNLGGRVVA